MPSSGMLRRVALIRTDISEAISASFIRVLIFLRSVRRLLVTASVVPSSPIPVTMMNEVLRSYETSVLTRTTRSNIPEDDILHNHRRESLKCYIALTGWTLQRRRNLSPVKYELGFYIPEDDILHNHRRESLKSYIALTGWAL
jgi:hypothetical protein